MPSKFGSDDLRDSNCLIHIVCLRCIPILLLPLALDLMNYLSLTFDMYLQTNLRQSASVEEYRRSSRLANEMQIIDELMTMQVHVFLVWS